MNTYHNKGIISFLITAILALSTFACNFIAGKSLNTLPTETALPKETSTPSQTLLSPNSVPMSSGVTLESATDTERELSGYQVAYLEDFADGFSGANQGVIDMYFGENHNFTVRINSSEPRLVWGTGWCAQGKETLNQNLKKIRFEMRVNGQPVDINQVYRSDNEHSWHTAGNFCLFYRIIVSGLPLGTTTLTSKTIINEPVNDGIKDYPTGELTRTYEVVVSQSLPTATSSVSSDNILSIRLPTDVEISTGIPPNILAENSIDIGLMSKPKTSVYYGKAERNKEYQLPFFWCATSSSILNQNLSLLSIEFSVNDEKIPSEYVGAFKYNPDKNWSCISYATALRGWKENSQYTLEMKISLLQNLNDGKSNYLAGNYIYKLIIDVP
jgi:hypothetical protein